MRAAPEEEVGVVVGIVAVSDSPITLATFLVGPLLLGQQPTVETAQNRFIDGMANTCLVHTLGKVVISIATLNNQGRASPPLS